MVLACWLKTLPPVARHWFITDAIVAIVGLAVVVLAKQDGVGYAVRECRAIAGFDIPVSTIAAL